MRTFTLEQVEAAMEDQGGFCLACGEPASGVEPDARIPSSSRCASRSEGSSYTR